MSDLTEAAAGPLWFMSLVATAHFVSVPAGVAVALVTMIAVLVWRVPQYYIRPL